MCAFLFISAFIGIGNVPVIEYRCMPDEKSCIRMQAYARSENPLEYTETRCVEIPKKEDE